MPIQASSRKNTALSLTQSYFLALSMHQCVHTCAHMHTHSFPMHFPMPFSLYFLNKRPVPFMVNNIIPKLLQNSELIKKVANFIWIEDYLVSKQLWHSDLETQRVCRKWTQKWGRGQANLPEAHQTLLWKDPTKSLKRLKQKYKSFISIVCVLGISNFLSPSKKELIYYSI